MNPDLDQPLKLTVSITEACNLACAHCYSHCDASPKPTELSTAEWLTFFDRVAEDGVIAALVEGGEPLLRPDLFDLLEHVRGRILVWLRTNATLVDASIASRLRSAGVGEVFVDLHGATAATHDRHAGVAGSWERSVAGIRHLLDAGLRTTPLMILTRRNAPELQAYVDLAHRLGARRAGVLRLYPIGRAREAWDELACSLDEMTDALGALRPPPDFHVMHSWHPKDGNCCWHNAAVTASGKATGCPYLRELVDYGDVRVTPWLETWAHPLYRRLRAGPPRREGSCPDCEANEGGAGGCRSTAYAFHGDWDAHDPFCATMNQGVDLRVLPERNLPPAA